MNLEFLRAGRAVRRYHTTPMLEYQRIDAHSYGVAQIARFLSQDLPPERQLAIIKEALDHDLAEHRTGDMPAPAKREMNIREQFAEHEARHMLLAGWEFQALSDEERRIVKIADCADGALHCIHERAMGNQHVRTPFYNFWTYLVEECKCGVSLDTREYELRNYIAWDWKAANGGEW